MPIGRNTEAIRRFGGLFDSQGRSWRVLFNALYPVGTENGKIQHVDPAVEIEIGSITPVVRVSRVLLQPFGKQDIKAVPIVSYGALVAFPIANVEPAIPMSQITKLEASGKATLWQG